ncbi:nuclear transport factor 2 family protein [Catenuloplanes indicus]|uniref:Ketosteroid isomerase-like protein n=1 Tax=Catenuloplanes indicus TaxID=137267 RepID=A0AAE3VVJ4_9ACTN|nr:nuclear transport factor 2 family protein [Catenuloplanes indicus]MDQ0363997.1 ketosteroid isomerase-like protein [Catenuloplanes indicus]
MTDLRTYAEKFLAAMENRSPDSIAPLPAPDVVEEVPMSFDGGPAPAEVLTGRDAVLEFLGGLTTMIGKVSWLDREFTVDEAAGVVMVECRGDVLLAGSGAPYRNRYVYKFVIRNGLIQLIREYANPITVAGLRSSLAP